MPSTTIMKPAAAALAVLALCFCLPAVAVERHALIIGNAAYQGEPPLRNTLNDARDMANLLQGMGFTIAGGAPLENADRTRMAVAVNRFLSRVENSDAIALIYYSGHGMRDRHDANYLIPVDARIEQEPDVRANGIALSDILEPLQRRPRTAVSLVIVDACRNNPFSVGAKGSKRGLERVNPARGTLLLYSASPGQQADDNPGGRNGLFTQHLLDQLGRPGVDVEDAFDAVSVAVENASGGEQIPWNGGNLRGKFYLAGDSATDNRAAAINPSGQGLDLIAWQSAERCGKAACYRAYLKDHPDGKFASMAKAMLETLAPRPQPVKPVPPAAPEPQAVEAELSLTRDERAKVQQALNRLGFAVGGADGVWGANTRAGIAAWQRGAGQTASGYLDGAGYKALLAQAAEREPKQGDSFRDRLRDGGEGPEMVVIPAGSFTMGSNQGDGDEKPPHRVSISRAFALGKTEVTFADYDRFCAATGRTKPADEGWGRGTRPVINVSWEDASAYAKWLSEQTGAEYRLPTEAEWEYAARAGTSTAYWWGEEPPVCRKGARNGAKFDDNKTCNDTGTEPVGSYSANAFGLYDTAGNVWEWVFDWKKGYPDGAVTDPVVRQGGSFRVKRGGSWYCTPRILRSAYRIGSAPGYSSNDLGFRLARTL